MLFAELCQFLDECVAIFPTENIHFEEPCKMSEKWLLNQDFHQNAMGPQGTCKHKLAIHIDVTINHGKIIC